MRSQDACSCASIDSLHQQGIGREPIRVTHEYVRLDPRLILLAAPAAASYYPHIGMEKPESCWMIPPRESESVIPSWRTQISATSLRCHRDLLRKCSGTGTLLAPPSESKNTLDEWMDRDPAHFVCCGRYGRRDRNFCHRNSDQLANRRKAKFSIRKGRILFGPAFDRYPSYG